MLKVRLPVGAALIALLATLLWLDFQWQGSRAAWLETGHIPGGFLLALFGMVVLVPCMVLELTRLLRAGGVRVWPVLFSMPISLAAFATVALHGWHMDAWARPAAIIMLIGLVPAIAALIHGNPAKGLAEIGRWILVGGWIGALPACWIALRAHSPWWVLVAAVLAVKCNDIGAYFAGSIRGRNPMALWISPHKTWEGFAGGALCSIAAGAWVGSQIPAGVMMGVMFGVSIAILGPFGDLFESVLKRQAGAKDSGNAIPGMGGVLDVLDSLLPTAPAALWLLAPAN